MRLTCEVCFPRVGKILENEKLFKKNAFVWSQKIYSQFFSLFVGYHLITVYAMPIHSLVFTCETS